MLIRILSLLIFSFITITFADSAVQTDWSGGSGVWGPVIDWGNEFYQSSDEIDWSYNPGSLLILQCIQEFTVDTDFDKAASVYSADIDGDGDMDILGAASWVFQGDDDITWWENVDGSGLSWVENTIDGNFDGAIAVYSEDIDGDGDMDVIGAGCYANQIVWWENVDGLGTSWIKHTVDSNFVTAYFVYSEDIDGDGDMDILGAAEYPDEITWWENLNGSGTSWTEHNIASDFLGAQSVYSADIDGDGDMDVLGAAWIVNDITWWENMDGSGTSWTEHNIAGGFLGAQSAYSEDIDGDGDMDVLGASPYLDEFTWWENVDGSGTTWTEHNIAEGFDAAYSVYSEDMDGDGDMDVLGAAFNSSDIVWWENIDGTGTSWAEHFVDTNFNAARSVYAEDIDGDGNMDVLGAASAGNDISWWRLSGYPSVASLLSSILDTQGDYPDWDYIDWNSQTPSGTSISFNIRASNNPGVMGPWSGDLTSPCSLEGIIDDGDKYVQYKVILETLNPDSTPTLNDVTISWNPLGIEETAEPIPQGTEMLPIAPNPSSTPAVRFGLSETASVKISIFDLSGRLISEIPGNNYTKGYHDVMIVDLSPGIYFCRMISGDFTAMRRFVVIE